MVNFCFRKKRYGLLMAAALLLSAVCGNHLHATNSSGSGDAPTAVNEPLPIEQAQTQAPEVGTKAPDFTFTKDGKSVKLSDFEYYYIILNFSSSPASSKVDADMVALAERYKEADAIFVTLPMDEYAEVAKQYGVSSAPVIFVVKPDGTIGFAERENIDLAKTLKAVFGI